MGKVQQNLALTGKLKSGRLAIARIEQRFFEGQFFGMFDLPITELLP